MLRLSIPLAVPFNYYSTKMFSYIIGVLLKYHFYAWDVFSRQVFAILLRIENESASIENQCIHPVRSTLFPLEREPAHARATWRGKRISRKISFQEVKGPTTKRSRT